MFPKGSQVRRIVIVLCVSVLLVAGALKAVGDWLWSQVSLEQR